jgi:hypothetical protein
MRPGWWVFRAGLLGAWLLVLSVTIHASVAGGPNGWIDAFVQTLHEPWPAQFNTDFTVHLVLMALWLFVRARSWMWGVLWAALAVLGGSLFSLLFLLALSFQVDGNVRRFLLGRLADRP